MKAKDVKLTAVQKLHTKRPKQKIKLKVCEVNTANPIIAYQMTDMSGITGKAFAHAFEMVKKHMDTEANRKKRVILPVFTTYRSQLLVDGSNLYAYVEADFITQPMRTTDDARLVAS